MAKVDYQAMDKADEKANEALLAALEQLGGERVADDDLEFKGKKLVLPESMTPQKGIMFLKRHIEQQEEETAFSRTFRYRPWDGAHAVQSALKKVFGTTGIAQATYSIFGKQPPKVITIDTGVRQQSQVPWGEVAFPPLEAVLKLGAVKDKEVGSLFSLTVTAPRKYKGAVEGLFKAIESELHTNSIYKGKAIDGAENPSFFDAYTVDAKKVIYTSEVMRQLNANIWALMEHTKAMQDVGVPLKRSVLIEGTYGTGKSLAAMITAQKAIENGWTFVQCRPGRDDLAATMQTAVLYQPSVVFFEDVDTVAQHGDPEAISKLLDLFDGIAAKGTELLAVLTTNHADKIHKGMLRPGRMDAVIHIGHLDVDSVEQLVKALVPANLLADNLDWESIGKAMDGYTPAFIKEAIDRTKRYAIARTGGHVETLETEDFVLAAGGLRDQLNLMDEAIEGTPPDPLTVMFSKLASDAAAKVVDGATFHDMSDDELTQPRFKLAAEEAFRKDNNKVNS